MSDLTGFRVAVVATNGFTQAMIALFARSRARAAVNGTGSSPAAEES